MSTPFSSGNSMGNAGTPSSNPSNLYSSISSQGMPEDSSVQESQETPEQASPADTAIQRFGKVFDSVKTLIENPEYSVASKEANEVKTAFSNWLNAVVAATSKARGESPTNYGG